MSEQVKVDDLEVFRHFRVALIKFAQAAGQSLANADSQISRMHSWLENEQTAHWQSQLRKRAEMVTKAREAVRQKKLYKDFAGQTRNAADEEKVLAQCIAAAEMAQTKLEATRKWLPRLERAAELYRSSVSRLSRTVEDDVPKAVLLLDRLHASLEQYVQIEAGGVGGQAAAAPTPFDESMSRGGESEISADPAKAENATPAAAGEAALSDAAAAPHADANDSAAGAPVGKEEPHVGQ